MTDEQSLPMNQSEDTTIPNENNQEDWRQWRHQHHHFHHHGGFWGIFLVFLGSIFLLNNFGILSWEVWRGIIRFWPLIFVLVGFDIIFGRSFVGRIIVTVLGLILTAFVIAYLLSITNPAFADWIQSQLPWWKNVISVSYNLPY